MGHKAEQEGNKPEAEVGGRRSNVRIERGGKEGWTCALENAFELVTH